MKRRWRFENDNEDYTAGELYYQGGENFRS